MCRYFDFFLGCGDPPANPSTEVVIVPHVSEDVRNKLLEGAMTILDNLENYEETLAVDQVFDRLNQWIHADPVGDSAAIAEWKADSLLSSLSTDYHSMCTEKSLRVLLTQNTTLLQFVISDGSRRLQKQLGGALDDVDIATSLFHWTIRSLAIQSDPPFTASADSKGVRWFERGEISCQVEQVQPKEVDFPRVASAVWSSRSDVGDG